MFYRQRILVIDGKYSSDDGLSTTTMISGAVIIGEEQFTEFRGSIFASDKNIERQECRNRNV
jgi:hypothetical protein